jgi:O-acetyl-ADP-ribose deacetylase (regulator of RNase III)
LPVGQAVATTAGRLHARWVIHTVGPRYTPLKDQSVLLASCYTESLTLASELGAESIAFPAISTGVYAYPLDEAARIAVTAVRSFAHVSPPKLVRFVLFSDRSLAAFRGADTLSGQ